MAYYSFKSDDDDLEKTNEFLGPGHVDSSIRQSLQMLWMMLPAAKKNVGGVEEEFRRLVDRALRDFREDAERFGKA